MLFFLTQEPDSLEKRPSIRSLELQSLSELLVSPKDRPQPAVEPLQVTELIFQSPICQVYALI